MRRADPKVRRAHAGRLALVSVAALVSACAIAGTPRAARPQLGGLDLSGYAGLPLSAPVAGETYGGFLESARMSEAVVSPRDIDPALRYVSSVPVPTPTSAVGILADVNSGTLTRFGIAGSTPSPRPPPRTCPRCRWTRPEC